MSIKYTIELTSWNQMETLGPIAEWLAAFDQIGAEIDRAVAAGADDPFAVAPAAREAILNLERATFAFSRLFGALNLSLMMAMDDDSHEVNANLWQDAYQELTDAGAKLHQLMIESGIVEEAES